MEGFSVDQCVASILCGETMEIDEVEMNYNCFDTGTEEGSYKLAASVATMAVLVYASSIWRPNTKKWIENAKLQYKWMKKTLVCMIVFIQMITDKIYKANTTIN